MPPSRFATASASSLAAIWRDELLLILFVAVVVFIIVLWAVAGCSTQQPHLPRLKGHFTIELLSGSRVAVRSPQPANVLRVSVKKVNILRVELDEPLDEAGFRHVATSGLLAAASSHL